MTAPDDFTRATEWLARHPHRAAAAVVLATAVDELAFMAEHGSLDQAREALDRVKAAEFPGAADLAPIPVASVMVAAVAHTSSSRRDRARTAAAPIGAVRPPRDLAPSAGRSQAVRVRPRRDDDHDPPGA